MPENKTRLQALFEVLPNIDMDDDGYPWFCIEAYDNTQKMNDHHDDCLNGCKACKKRFWEEIIPDQKEESSDLHAIIDELEYRIDKLEKKVSDEALIFREVSKRNQKTHRELADRIAALEEYHVESMNEQKTDEHGCAAETGEVAPVVHAKWIPIDEGSGAECSNCGEYYDSSMREQQNNKRSNHIVYLGEIGHTISEWSEILGIGKTTIRMRLESGWSDEDALTAPVRKRTRGYRPSASSGAKMDGGNQFD